MEKLPKCPVEKEFERKSAQEILQSIEASKYSVDICNWGMRAFASIAGAALIAQDTHSIAEFLDDGGCEAVVNIMSRYSDCSEIVAMYGCLTISILSWSMSELREFLGELGACEIVVYAASIHIGHPEISEYGTRAIFSLARNNISNSYKLSCAGACESLIQLGNFGFNVRDEHCTSVAMNTCLGIAFLSEAINAQRFLNLGTASLVTELGKLHINHEDVVCAVVKSICSLASLSAHLREDLGKVGACMLLLDVLNQYEEGTTCLQLEACEAIMHLSLNPNNTDRLSSLGTCETLLKLGKRLMDCSFGPEIITGGMLNMATYGTMAVVNRQRLTSFGAEELLRAAQFNVKASCKARENIHTLLEILCIKDNNSEGAAVSNVVSVINGSEMKGTTLPLQVELREEVIIGEVGEEEAHEQEPLLPLRSDSAANVSTADDLFSVALAEERFGAGTTSVDENKEDTRHNIAINAHSGGANRADLKASTAQVSNGNVVYEV